MAHEIDLSNGRENIAFVGEVPWHGLGQRLMENASIDEWREAAGMGWSALATIPSFVGPDGKNLTVDSHRVLNRSDTGAVLGMVSADYKVVQPQEILEFFRELVDGSIFTMETAGCLRGGRKVWALAKATDELRLGKEDVIGRYLLLATSYDKSLVTLAQQTSIRVVCQNTLSAALWNADAGTEKQIRLNHLQTFNPAEVKAAMALDNQWASFAEAIAKLSAARITNPCAAEFFLDTYYPPELREAEEWTSRQENMALNRVDRLMEIYEGAPGQELASARGTAWGLVNAVTYHVDHESRSQSQDLRLDKAWFGSGADLKKRAFQSALTYATN
jgi:phage/plasmid-like protein (TIGR03299 family)